MLGLSGRAEGYSSFSREIDACIRAMNNANLAIYPVDARGLSSPANSEASRSGFGQVQREWKPTQMSMTATSHDTMLDLAEGTGGKAWFNSTDFAKAIRTSVDDASFTYTLGFYPTDVQANGKYHALKLKVDQPGITLRYRKGYIDLPEQSQNEATRKADLHNTVNSPLEATELSLVTQVKEDPTNPENLELLIRVDPRGLTLTQENNTWNGTIDVLFVQKDTAGKQYNGREDTLNLHLNKERYNSVAHHGLAYRQRVIRAPLATELRVVVRDAATGATGSLTIPFIKLKD